MQKKRPESALIVTYTKTGHVLMMERKDWPGFWQSVTGSLEPGEQAIQAAIRELKEETGLSVEQGNFVDRHHQNQYHIFEAFLHKYEPGETQNTEHVFTFEVEAPCPIQLTEHVRYEWLPKAAAQERAYTATDKKAIAQWVKETV